MSTTYLRNDPYKAPELLEVFHCVAVANNPRNGEPRAFGFAKGLTEPVEGWYSTVLKPEVWAVGWIENAEVLFDLRTEATDVATEAFVDVADAERYAQRDDYVNGPDDVTAEVEHVDYAEAADVREIERDLAIEAGDDSDIDRQVAEDDVRAERQAEQQSAQERWFATEVLGLDGDRNFAEQLDALDAESGS